MLTYVKIQKDGQATFRYASLQLQDHFLILTWFPSFLRPFQKVIDLTKVYYLGEDQYFGARRIILGCEDEQYAIFQNGLAVIEELRHRLSLISEVKDYGKYPRCS